MPYPIGIQNFESLRKGGFAYVDKTDLAYQIAATGRYYFLSRPRRFGKSLLLSTLEAYFQGKKELFEGLAIGKLEKDWASYPVLHLDLYQCGYLTIKESFPDFNACTLGFPNQEVRNGFLRMQLSYYAPKGGMDSDVLILRLYQSLVSGNPEEMMKIPGGLFAKQNYQIQGKAEKNVQYAMSIIFNLLGQHVHTECQTSNGRMDVLIENKDYVYILELKINASADEALQQIEGKGHARPYAADTRKLFKIGISFPPRPVASRNGLSDRLHAPTSDAKKSNLSNRTYSSAYHTIKQPSCY